MFDNRLHRGLLVVCLSLFGCSSGTEEPVEKVQANSSVRNLVLICMDTVRADVFYRLGELDKDSLGNWQKDALVFRQASSAAPWTLPSVTSVFTGLLPVQHGMGQLPGDYKNVNKSIPTDLYKGTPLLAQTALAEGYRTGIITRNGWTYNNWRSKGLVAGFSRNVKFTHKEYPIKDTVWPLMVEKWRTLFTRDISEAPTFYFLHLMEAHDWHLQGIEELDAVLSTLTQEQRDRYRSLAPGPACEEEQSEDCKIFETYAYAVLSMREAVATVLEALKAEGLLQDTAVIVFADHGEEFEDHKGDGRPETSPGHQQYWGHGHGLYQEQVHVPLMVWHPDFQGRDIQQPVSLIDIAPTAARWLGFEFMPDGWQGRFLDDTLNGLPETGERVIYASGISMGQEQISARQGAKKGIWYTLSDLNQYFDLDRDPLELHPLETPDLIMQFDGVFLDYVQLRPDKEVIPTRMTKKHLKGLQSIGYLQGVEADDDAD